MSKIYIIKDEYCNWGVVQSKKDVAPFIIFTGVLGIGDNLDNDFSIVDLLQCDFDERTVVDHLQMLSFQMQQMIFEKFGILIKEEEIWNYAEYKHNKMLEN